MSINYNIHEENNLFVVSDVEGEFVDSFETLGEAESKVEELDALTELANND